LLVWMYLMPRTKFWPRWTGRMNQYSPVLRLAAASLAAYVVTFSLNLVPHLPSNRPGEFGPEVAGILIGFGLTLALLPNGRFSEDQQEAVVPSRAGWPHISSPAAQVASAVAI